MAAADCCWTTVAVHTIWSSHSLFILLYCCTRTLARAYLFPGETIVYHAREVYVMRHTLRIHALVKSRTGDVAELSLRKRGGPVSGDVVDPPQTTIGSFGSVLSSNRGPGASTRPPVSFLGLVASEECKLKVAERSSAQNGTCRNLVTPSSALLWPVRVYT